MRLLIMLALLLSFGLHAQAFRCSGHVIKQGTLTSQLLEFCGQPASKEKVTTNKGSNYIRKQCNASGQCQLVPCTSNEIGCYASQNIEQSYELWTYDFGYGRLLYRLKVDDGQIQDIQTFPRQ
ncbi:DUF2845 domain-containing protein [Dongshaea marina]|uniref:DUF2845 domain-containing protein n=1 Tax=Dongshaea marina TaxID=2047966 RepID=UPI000D3E3877|nr:DUF2845 domain-containing protein [Dongshaea marina]